MFILLYLLISFYVYVALSMVIALHLPLLTTSYLYEPFLFPPVFSSYSRTPFIPLENPFPSFLKILSHGPFLSPTSPSTSPSCLFLDCLMKLCLWNVTDNGTTLVTSLQMLVSLFFLIFRLSHTASLGLSKLVIPPIILGLLLSC